MIHQNYLPFETYPSSKKWVHSFLEDKKLKPRFDEQHNVTCCVKSLRKAYLIAEKVHELYNVQYKFMISWAGLITITFFTFIPVDEEIPNIQGLAGIYQITNLINKKRYIGKAKDIYSRWKYYRRENSYKTSKGLIYAAIKKYGIQNFRFDILEILPPDDKILLEKEKYFIKIKHTFIDDPECSGGYNLTPGGDGVTASEITRKKMSDNWNRSTIRSKGYHHTAEARERMSLARKGKDPPNKGIYGKVHFSETAKENSRIQGLRRTLIKDYKKGIKVIFNDQIHYFVSARELNRTLVGGWNHVSRYLDMRLGKIPCSLSKNYCGKDYQLLKDAIIEYCPVEEVLEHRPELQR
ncbi:MAG: GIY-YIG nuclease family protein [Bacteroidales bacterium]|jgi:group I intron endonuclease|nr:GIY-YIG nuclease family protein [Bacteroidales bacterium]